MAPACRNPAHGPDFHPWPTFPANLTVLSCEQFCQWCKEPSTAKTANNFRAHARRHLAEYKDEFSIARASVGRPSIAIPRAASASAGSGSTPSPVEAPQPKKMARRKGKK